MKNIEKIAKILLFVRKARKKMKCSIMKKASVTALLPMKNQVRFVLERVGFLLIKILKFEFLKTT